MAAQNGHTECVTLLLQNGANVLQKDSKKRTSLTIAIQNHHKYVNSPVYVYSLRITPDITEGVNQVKVCMIEVLCLP